MEKKKKNEKNFKQKILKMNRISSHFGVTIDSSWLKFVNETKTEKRNKMEETRTENHSQFQNNEIEKEK